MTKFYKNRAKGLQPRSGNGRFRKLTGRDVGIGGACENCRHLTIRHYDGDPRDPFPDPRKWRYRCFTCEPETEEELALKAEIEAEKPKRKTLGQIFHEIAAEYGKPPTEVEGAKGLSDED